jgi:putative hydrolase of the HAD superfamily
MAEADSICTLSSTYYFFSMSSRILLLDLDHTLYPSTAPTLDAVDARITRFIETTLHLPEDQADHMRRELCARYGTTLRGLETLHGVSREAYTTFIQDLEDHLMPPADPRLRDWLIRAAQRHPTYLFTNARRDWADRCLAHIGIADLLLADPEVQGRIRGIFDIDFMDWVGKPEASAFTKVEAFLLKNHPPGDLIFADDRLDNLEGARARGWRTIWVRPHTAARGAEGAAVTAIASAAGHRVVDSLLELNPDLGPETLA